MRQCIRTLVRGTRFERCNRRALDESWCEAGVLEDGALSRRRIGRSIRTWRQHDFMSIPRAVVPLTNVAAAVLHGDIERFIADSKRRRLIAVGEGNDRETPRVCWKRRPVHLLH